MYDGYVSVSSSGAPRPINQCAQATGLGDPRSGLPSAHPPFMLVNSQAETFAGYVWRQAGQRLTQGTPPFL